MAYRFDQLIQAPQEVMAAARAITGNSVLRFPAQQGKYGISLAFSKYSYRAVRAENIGGEEQRGAIILPVPTNLDETLSIGSKATQLDYSGAAAATAATELQGASSVEDITSKLTSAGSKTIEGITQASFGDFLEYTGFAARFLSSISNDLRSGINVGTGVAANPYESVDFDGVRLKTHDFSWSLSPSSAAESDTLRRIINTLKANALPNFTGLAGASETLLLEFPSLVQITLVGLDQSYYQSIFKPCLIQSVSVSYNDGPHLNVYAGSNGGKPVSVDLKLQLIETQIHTRDDYAGQGA